MHLACHPRRLLFLLLLAATGALLGCTMVAETTTGVTLDRANPSACIKTCVTSQTELVKAEAAYHQEQVRLCEALPESEREACEEAEADRHSAVMHAISGSRKDCLSDCHRQGSGSAG